MKKLCILFLAALLLSSCKQEDQASSTGLYTRINRQEILQQKIIPVYSYKIIKTYPHDVSCYTEGLVINNGFLYEGTGLLGQSKIFKTSLNNGSVLNHCSLSPEYFGEGITILGNNLYQLTYETNIGFVYDKNTLKLKETFHYPYQGWGLTTDGKYLIMSNGSSAIIFLNPKTFQTEKYLIVSDNIGPVGFLNELEYIDGKIYANIWQTDFIAIISEKTGKVRGWIDLTGINPSPKNLQYPYVLNGIAHFQENQDLLITGKNWPKFFEIQLQQIK